MTQVPVRTPTTKKRQRPYTAGAGRGNNHRRRPVCISPYPPLRGHHTEARRVHSRIDQLLESRGLSRCRAGGPVWEEEGGQPMHPQANAVAQPPFILERQHGKFWLSTWGGIYEAAPYLWQREEA